VQDLVNEMKTGGVRILIMEPFFDPRIPQKVSRDTGVPLAVLPTSVGAEDSIKTYFDLFDRMFAELGVALKGGKA
jgi:ABC-type Zn uptake system ZnuABC Zn-binding protein ZnuA